MQKEFFYFVRNMGDSPMLQKKLGLCDLIKKSNGGT